MRSSDNLAGVGVDLVSWSRVDRFLTQHSFEFLKRLLTPTEQNQFQDAVSARDFFARCFTAKEAYFKASGGALLDEEGFRAIETQMSDGDAFRVTGQSGGVGEGRFFATPDGLGAEVLIWKKGRI